MLTETQLLSIAGICPSTVARRLTESPLDSVDASQGAAPQDAPQQTIETKFGEMGVLVANILQTYADDLVGSGEETPSETPETLKGYVTDMVTDLLQQVLGSPEYAELATKVSGQVNQSSTSPDQMQLDV